MQDAELSEAARERRRRMAGTPHVKINGDGTERSTQSRQRRSQNARPHGHATRPRPAGHWATGIACAMTDV